MTQFSWNHPQNFQIAAIYVRILWQRSRGVHWLSNYEQRASDLHLPALLEADLYRRRHSGACYCTGK